MAPDPGKKLKWVLLVRLKYTLSNVRSNNFLFNFLNLWRVTPAS
jgi:hypothetical protein